VTAWLNLEILLCRCCFKTLLQTSRSVYLGHWDSYIWCAQSCSGILDCCTCKAIVERHFQLGVSYKAEHSNAQMHEW